MDPVTRHVTLFNEGVRTGDFSAWLDTFHEDCTVTFVGLPLGPIAGRPALAEAYRVHPPSSAMRVIAATEQPERVAARFVWDAAPHTGGVFALTLRDGLVADLTVTLNSAPPPPATGG